MIQSLRLSRAYDFAKSDSGLKVIHQTNGLKLVAQLSNGRAEGLGQNFSYLWLAGNGRMVVIVVIIVPHSSIPY